MDDPRSEYWRRLEARRSEAARLERLHIHLGNIRLLTAIAAAVIAWATFGRGAQMAWLMAPGAVFLGLTIFHEIVNRGQRRAARSIAFYESGIARIEDRWAGSGETGERFRDPAHAYAEDLDLFGQGGLFELLCTARTSTGQEVLARWLLAGAPPDVVLPRQAAIDELRASIDLREDLALLGEEVRAGVHPAALITWAEAPPILPSDSKRTVAAVLSVLVVVGAVILAALDFSFPLILALAASASFGWRLRPRVLRVAAEAEGGAHDLALLAAVLERIERERFRSARLIELRAALDTNGQPPSVRIARLNRLMELLDSRDNLVMRIIGPPLLYTTHMAYALEAWRLRSGKSVRRWLEASGEIEALCALAAYAYEHPGDPFPEFAAGAIFRAEALGHPLLPEARMVRNDVALGGDGVRLLLVSGSNMSGKSTLLRSVGVNAVLSLAGAPVRARRLTLSPLSVGASIRVTDSLQGGSSRFYAEITRLRKLLDLTAGPAPLLFLLDELLHGTNSHDRRIGAEGVVRGLVERGAIGLVTTHDLALTHIVESLAGLAANVHFEDHLEGGQITFDYRMRPGVVTKSNALELMRSVGLDV